MDLDGSATPWPGVVRSYSTPGLSTCIEERRLCSGGLPLPASLIEAEALRLAEWAFARRDVLVLCPPDPLAPIPALIAAAVHVSDMASHYKATRQSLGSSRHVAVVTTDYHARGVYRGLGVRNPRSGDVATLRNVVPAATLGADGIVRVLGSDPRNGWSTIFVPSVGALRSLDEVDLIVVSLPAHDVGAVLDVGVPVVVVATDPSDPFLASVGDGVPVFGSDHGDLERARSAGDLPPRLARRLGGGACEVVAVPAGRVCENAALFWQDIGPLVRSGGRSQVARELGREAFGLFHDLAGLALPLDLYESMTAPIRVRLDAVAAATRMTRGEVRDLYLPMVEAELRDLAAALGSNPPKRAALVRLLRELSGHHEDVLLVTRTSELARLHRIDLAERADMGRVRVTSIGALPDERPADVAVLTGMAPTWARWVYRAGIATSLRVLAYTPERTVDAMVDHTYDEVELVRRTVALQHAREKWFARACVKDRVWSRLSGEPRLVADEHPEVTPRRGDVATVVVTTQEPPDVPPGLWDGDRWLADLEPVGAGAEAVRERAGHAGPGAAVVDVVAVVFDDGRWTLMETGSTVTRFRAGSTQPEQATPVASLRPGDRILLFDGDSRKDLLSKVIEVAVEVPALAVAAGWLAYWRQVLGSAYRRFGSYAAFTDALRAEGCAVQTQTVRLWVIGVTIGPEDDKDVRRVGSVMNDAVLRDNHREVCRGIRTLRGAHVRLGQRLSTMAMRVGSAAAAGLLDGDEVVDDRSGLTVADFRESIEILTVVKLEPAGKVPYILVGRLNDRMDNDVKESNL